MPLKVNGVPLKLFRVSPEKMVEADFKQSGGGGIRGNVAADTVVHPVGANHHRQSIPANQALDPAFDFLVARKNRLFVGRNGVDVRSIRREGMPNPQRFRASTKPVEQKARRFPAFLFHNGIEGFDPFLHFLGVNAKDFCIRIILHVFLSLRSIGGHT